MDNNEALEKQKAFTTMLKKLRKEILSDPESLGYVGKSAQEQADILNSPFKKMVKTKKAIGSRLREINIKVRDEIVSINDFTIKNDGTVEIIPVDPVEKLRTLLEKEIKEDPEKLGYKNKSLDQIKSLIAEGGETEEQKEQEVSGTRLSLVLGGVYNAPNLITAEIISEALA